jgi:hypothetical protein
MINIPAMMIDTIQNAKKQVIQQHITNPTLKDIWTKYVDTQTAFAHVALTTFTTVAVVATKELLETRIEKILNPLAINWTRAGLDAWADSAKKP